MTGRMLMAAFLFLACTSPASAQSGGIRYPPPPPPPPGTQVPVLTHEQWVKQAFNDPSHTVRILLATDAAAEGLNLQRTARYLLHFDCPWNPSKLEQRNGRLDRHGQARDVTVSLNDAARGKLAENPGFESDKLLATVEKTQTRRQGIEEPEALHPLEHGPRPARRVDARDRRPVRALDRRVRDRRWTGGNHYEAGSQAHERKDNGERR